jgi:hypothetical protein
MSALVRFVSSEDRTFDGHSGRRWNPSAVPREVRLQAALLVPTRFAGRKDLEAMARQDDRALATLRQRLGFPGADQELVEAREAQINQDLSGWATSRVRSDAHPFSGVETPTSAEAKRLLALSPRQRLHWALQNKDPSMGGLATLVAGPELQARRSKHSGRVQAREFRDPLSVPLRAERTMIDKRLREAVENAHFRTTKHAHTEALEVVEPGHEGVSSFAGTMGAREAGMSKAYQRAARTVAYSEHRWRASRAILTPEVRALNSGRNTGLVYLRPDLRIRQGRGTSLVVERLTAHGKRVVWA